MAKQPIKKKNVEDFSISNLKDKIGLSVKSSKDIERTNTDKPLDWIVLPQAYQDALKIPGIPIGYLSACMGWSDTGKSSLKNCIIAACQKQGIIPVIYETESNFDWQHAIDCGVEATPIYGEIYDEETGEMKEGIINYDGNFLYFDNSILCELYGGNDYSTGKEVKTKRRVAVLEDIAYSINDLLDKQDEGIITKPMCFIWDSIGSISCYKSYKSKVGNAMFDAAGLSNAFNTIINTRIPSSRKLNNPYTNTFFAVNKIWNDGMNSMGGLPSLELKGGKSFYFALRLLIHVGGKAKASTEKLKATAKGEQYRYGITTKIETVKNHLPAPYNITYYGKISCVHCGIISPNDLEKYKKEYMPELLGRLQNISGSNISENDIEFESEGSSDE